jgi:hypothetical protein
MRLASPVADAVDGFAAPYAPARSVVVRGRHCWGRFALRRRSRSSRRRKSSPDLPSTNNRSSNRKSYVRKWFAHKSWRRSACHASRYAPALVHVRPSAIRAARATTRARVAMAVAIMSRATRSTGVIAAAMHRSESTWLRASTSAGSRPATVLGNPRLPPPTRPTIRAPENANSITVRAAALPPNARRPRGTAFPQVWFRYTTHPALRMQS